MTAGSNGVWTEVGYHIPPESGRKDVKQDMSMLYGDDDSDPRKIFVNDLRGNQDKYSFGPNGFQYAKHATNFAEFGSVAAVKAKYYPEIAELVKKELGAKEVFPWQHSMRHSIPGDCHAEGTVKGPAGRPHVDFTPESSRDYFRYISDDATYERLKECKLVHLSVWRPLKPVERDPLGVVDSTTYDDDDLIELRREPASGNPEAPDVRSFVVNGEGSPKHKWYYLSKQQPDEVLMIKLSDEKPGNRITGIPHSSFAIAGTEGGLSRESIEVRCLVLC